MKLVSKIKKCFLTTLGKHVFDLLENEGNWESADSRLIHTSGLKLCMIPGQFDVADTDVSDFITELSIMDRFILWPKALRIRHKLKYSILHSE